jgi:aminoglycoside phosphotransferase family enzyme
MTHPRLAPAMFRPEFYPHRPEHGELIQTHISYIFIAGAYVYKDGDAFNVDVEDYH